MLEAYRMATATLSIEGAVEELDFRTDGINDWYLAHAEAGSIMKAISLLDEERIQCVMIMSWLSDRLEHAKK